MDTNTTEVINWDDLKEQYKESGIGLRRWCELNDVSFNKMRYQLYQADNFNKRKNKAKATKTTALIKVIPAKHEPVNNTIDINIGKASITVDDSTNLQLLSKLMEVLA